MANNLDKPYQRHSNVARKKPLIKDPLESSTGSKALTHEEWLAEQRYKGAHHRRPVKDDSVATKPPAGD